MKILMTTDTVGGVWTYCLQLAEALQPYGINICLAAKGEVTPDQSAAAQSVKNVSVLARDFKLEWMENPWDEVEAAGQWLQSVAETYQPDLIHLNDYCHAALRWRAPTLVVGHSCVFSWMVAVRGAEPGPEWARYRQEVRRGLQAADLVVAPTRQMLSALEYFYGAVPARQVVYNGREPGRFFTGTKQPFVFSAGRFWDEGKNIRTLAAVAPDLRWPVRVAGLRHPDGADGQVDNVEWLGALSAQQMVSVYSEASIYALPALYEPFGLTALEAAMSGCALVLGDIPSLRELWGDAACYVTPRDAAGLSAAINRLIDDEDFRTRLADRALARGNKLTAERMAAAYVECYDRLLTSKRLLSSMGTS